ncbi:MAG: spore coat protein CotH [Eubacteriaceae bacterium]|nr:spore coat protein CotH [Eubacteriaceae bacterium]
MSTSKNIERICILCIVLALAVTFIFMNAEGLGIAKNEISLGYEQRLFDTSVVHTIEITMEGWESFIETCTEEEYSPCDLEIDGESYKNVAIRGKGNTSLTQVAAYGNGRYSFKIEFDHYDSSKTYHGLDKLCLNNIISDTTYMKDFLTYQMMGYIGAASPLTSFVYITVNGEDWGLYLAVESIEESFLYRNYGRGYGELYKPDSISAGGGRGNGKNFEMDFSDTTDKTPSSSLEKETFSKENLSMENFEQSTSRESRSAGEAGGMGSSEVLLIYSDDEASSYSDIFDNAKTDITSADKKRLIASLKQLNEGEDIEQVVDTTRVIKYFAVHNFVCNFDSYTGSMYHNYYLYESEGVLTMLPWDYNLAFGGFGSSSSAESLVNYPIDTPASGQSDLSRPMLDWIFDSEEYTELYHSELTEFVASFFESGYFEKLMEETYGLIASYVQKDPTKFCTYEEFTTGYETLKRFCLLRAQSVKAQAEGTLASTKEGQQNSSESLISAENISISDMGGMNMGGGGFDKATGEGTLPYSVSLPNEENIPEGSDLSEQPIDENNIPDLPNTTIPEGIPDGDSPPEMPEGFDRDSFNFEGNPFGGNPSGDNPSGDNSSGDNSSGNNPFGGNPFGGSSGADNFQSEPGGNNPGGFSEEAQGSADQGNITEYALILAGCIGALAVGIWIAGKYRRWA